MNNDRDVNDLKLQVAALAEMVFALRDSVAGLTTDHEARLERAAKKYRAVGANRRREEKKREQDDDDRAWTPKAYR